MGLELMPWQRHVVDVALELDEDGSLFYDEVDLWVMRQCGKTVIVKAKTFWRLVALARTHGRQRSTYFAQTRQAARKKLESDFAQGLRESSSFREVAHSRVRPRGELEWRLSTNNNDEKIEFGNGSVLQLDAPSRTGGHGDTLDDATIDEAFAHHDDEVEVAVRPAQATRRDAQLWVASAAGDAKSAYQYRKVLAGRAATAAGAHGRIASFEYSAPDDADPADPKVWAEFIPAFGLTISERFLMGELDRAQRKGQEGIDLFRRSYLNQWPDPPVIEGDDDWRLWPAVDWADCLDPKAEIVGSQTFAVAVAEDRSASAIVAAGLDDHGRTVVDVVEYERGTAWLVPRIGELSRKWGGQVAVALHSPAASLLDDLERELEHGVIEPVTTERYARFCGRVFDAVVEHRLRHVGQPSLEVAVRGAEKRSVGDSWVISQRRSSVDVSSLSAAILAAGVHGVGEDGDPSESVW